MLLVGVLECVCCVLVSFECGDQVGKGKVIGEVCVIVGYFNGLLDYEVGGEIVGNLLVLYDYVLQCLIEVNLYNDCVVLDELLQLLGEIDSVWNVILYEQWCLVVVVL